MDAVAASSGVWRACTSEGARRSRVDSCRGVRSVKRGSGNRGRWQFPVGGEPRWRGDARAQGRVSQAWQAAGMEGRDAWEKKPAQWGQSVG